MSFLSHLSWRYATKRFDATRKVSAEDLDKILESIQMTPTSYGLQAYHFYIVSDPEILAKIQEISYNQPQVGSASHLIVFCARNDLEKAKDDYFNLLSDGNAEIRANLSGFEQMVGNTISTPKALEWAKRQTYISLGFALAACAELGIDSCPMEGFDSEALSRVLDLSPDHEATLLLPIGYRSGDEEPRAKKRFSKEELFTVIDAGE